MVFIKVFMLSWCCWMCLNLRFVLMCWGVCLLIRVLCFCCWVRSGCFCLIWCYGLFWFLSGFDWNVVLFSGLRFLSVILMIFMVIRRFCVMVLFCVGW